MEDSGEVKYRLNMVKKGLLPVKGVKIFHDVPKYAYMQGLFSLGDRRVAGVVREILKGQDWMKAAEASGIDRGFYISRKKEFNEILPWDFIDMGIPKDRLWAEYQKALSSK
jgi:hypothetical protein